VVQQVEKHFGRLTVQKLMRVRNSRGHTAIHLALTAGTLLNWPTCTFAPSRSDRTRT
jgi:predicted metal-binding protein